MVELPLTNSFFDVEKGYQVWPPPKQPQPLGGDILKNTKKCLFSSRQSKQDKVERMLNENEIHSLSLFNDNKLPPRSTSLVKEKDNVVYF